MKRFLFFFLFAFAVFNVSAEEFSTRPDGDADFVTFINQSRDSSNEIVVLNVGKMSDFLTYMNETPELLQIYKNKEKTAMFLSVENPAQYIQPEKCLVNTIPYNVLKEMGAPEEKLDCSWRLFCGSEMNYDAPYAVELCGKMIQD